MQVQIFSIPTFSSQVQLDEMNKFMRSHRVIE